MFYTKETRKSVETKKCQERSEMEEVSAETEKQTQWKSE
jgi:hypothetical protein